MTRMVGVWYVIVKFTILLNDCDELNVSSWWRFLKAIGKSSKVMNSLLCWCWPINWCRCEIEVCIMLLCINVGLWICELWDHGKDMIMQVDNVYLVCLTHYDYDMLISQMKVVMKGNSHLNLKSLWSWLYEELICYDLW